eukprot:gene8126-1372_t
MDPEKASQTSTPSALTQSLKGPLLPESPPPRPPDSPFANSLSGSDVHTAFSQQSSGAGVDAHKDAVCLHLSVDHNTQTVKVALAAKLDVYGYQDTANMPVPNLPENPLELLHKLKESMKVLIARVRELCLLERDASGPPTGRFSSLSQDPSEWKQIADQPCSGERMLLMFDRWNKLLKSFYNEKKDTFDISKIPDIYDSSKYDAIHNAHLKLPNLQDLFTTAKTLADAVIPNEYGLDPSIKLSIGAKICSELLGKLLCDMAAMREESVAASAVESYPPARGETFHYIQPGTHNP